MSARKSENLSVSQLRLRIQALGLELHSLDVRRAQLKNELNDLDRQLIAKIKKKHSAK